MSHKVLGVGKKERTVWRVRIGLNRWADSDGKSTADKRKAKKCDTPAEAAKFIREEKLGHSAYIEADEINE